MYLCATGVTDTLTQYQCKGVPNVKNIINRLTGTISKTEDWKSLCNSVKRKPSDSVDYICFIKGKEQDCSVNVGYDTDRKSYYVWIEI